MPDPLVLLVRQLLIAGSDGLSAQQLAAYIAGWTAALELVERTDLSSTHADPAVHAAVAHLIDRIRDAQRAALHDDDDDGA